MLFSYVDDVKTRIKVIQDAIKWVSTMCHAARTASVHFGIDSTK